MTYCYSLFLSSSALHLTAKRSASVTADTSFKVFGLTRLRIEPSLPASKANALNHLAMANVGYLAPAEPCFFVTKRGFINAIICEIASTFL